MVKTGASLIPGGSLVVGVVAGQVIDEAIIHGSTKTLEQVGRNVLATSSDDIMDACQDALDTCQDVVEAIGNGDGLEEIGNVIEGVGDSLGDLASNIGDAFFG